MNAIFIGKESAVLAPLPIENPGDSGSEEKSGGSALFRPYCSIVNQEEVLLMEMNHQDQR